MSNQLLKSFVADESGPLATWLSGLGREARIAWYPSAGMDVRNLWCVSAAYQNTFPLDDKSLDVAPPDIFIHTNFGRPFSNSFPYRPVLYENKHTRVVVKNWEGLRELILRPWWEVMVGTHHHATDWPSRGLYLEVEVQNRFVGTFNARMIYFFAENISFFTGCLLAQKAKITHLIQVCYGQLEGGAVVGPGWLRRTFFPLGVEVVLGDGAERHPELPRSGGRGYIRGYPKTCLSNRIEQLR